MMNLRITSLVILFAIFTTSVAQVKVSGKIIDTDTKEAVEFANIALLQHDSTFVAGASTDTEGLFAFTGIPEGKYLLSATFVGYGKKFLQVDCSGKDTDLGYIDLAASDVALKDVTVTANSVIQKADRKVIVPTDAQVRASNSGVTLLRNLQLSRIVVNPINNTITVPSGEAVQLRLNGVEVTMAEISCHTTAGYRPYRIP